MPWVARGAGTGLSGGATPVRGGVVIGLSRLRRILEVDLPNARVVVEPGVTNLAGLPRGRADALLSARPVEPGRLHRRRQRRGELGRRALLQVRLHHELRLTGLDLVLPDGDRGRARRQGGSTGPATTCSARSSARRERSASRRAITLRVVAGAGADPHARRVLRDDGAPRARRSPTSSPPGSCRARSRSWTASRSRAAEQATGIGNPYDAGAALIVELDGPEEECEQRVEAVVGLCEAGAGARDPRGRRLDAERELIWRARKAAFAAMGRVAPSYYVQDSVIPRTRLAEVLGPHRGARERVRPPGRERLPRGRREPPPARRLRRFPSGRGGARRGAGRPDRARVRRGGRLDHRRARRRDRQEALHAGDVLRARPGRVPEAALRVRPRAAGQSRARSCRPRACAARCPGPYRQHPVEAAGSRSGFEGRDARLRRRGRRAARGRRVGSSARRRNEVELGRGGSRARRRALDRRARPDRRAQRGRSDRGARRRRSARRRAGGVRRGRADARARSSPIGGATIGGVVATGRLGAAAPPLRRGAGSAPRHDRRARRTARSPGRAAR